jgi:hypothetical protein
MARARHCERPRRVRARGEDPEAFWASFAGELEWIKPWTTVLEWKPPDARWFTGGQLNASVNCLDRHVRGARRNKAALIWEGEPGDRRTLTYFRAASAGLPVRQRPEIARREEGRSRGALHALVPELAMAMLACARIGAVHSVVFGGFSAESLRDRINDAQATGARHCRRRLPPRSDRPAQADGRRGAERTRPRSSTWWCTSAWTIAPSTRTCSPAAIYGCTS